MSKFGLHRQCCLIFCTSESYVLKIECRKKVTGKKVTDLDRKKSHRKKSHKNKTFFFYFMLEMDIIIFIITNIIENIFVWVDVLCPVYQFSAMPGWS